MGGCDDRVSDLPEVPAATDSPVAVEPTVTVVPTVNHITQPRPEGLVVDATPTPTPTVVATLVPTVPTPEDTPAPAPTPGQEEVPEVVAPPAPEAATGTLVYNVPLTVYTCYGDSTGAYCPGDPVACGGTVSRGVAACGGQWSCGQQFRIVGDPLDMVYTCTDRGSAVVGIDVWFLHYYDNGDGELDGRPWRMQVRASYDDATVTVELLP